MLCYLNIWHHVPSIPDSRKREILIIHTPTSNLQTPQTQTAAPSAAAMLQQRQKQQRQQQHAVMWQQFAHHKSKMAHKDEGSAMVSRHFC
jgi:hypothetical protein